MYNPNGNQFGNQNNPYMQPRRRTASPMSLASIVCAIIGLFCIITGVFALVFGSLAVLFASLSKGSNERVQRPASYGRIVGIIVSVIGAILVIYSFNVVFSQYGSLENFYNTYVESIQEEYELDLDDAGAL